MNVITRWISPFLKAHAAGLGAAVALLIADLNSLKPGQGLTMLEWIAIAGAYLGVGAVVATVPNTPKPGDTVLVPAVVAVPDVSVTPAADVAVDAGPQDDVTA